MWSGNHNPHKSHDTFPGKPKRQCEGGPRPATVPVGNTVNEKPGTGCLSGTFIRYALNN